MIENERIKIYPASQEQMKKYIVSEMDEELKKAYEEMLDGCLSHPGEWDWYAMWMIETGWNTYRRSLFQGNRNRA